METIGTQAAGRAVRAVALLGFSYVEGQVKQRVLGAVWMAIGVRV
jgi:hypothetical protein